VFALACETLPIGLPRVSDCPGALPDTTTLSGGDFVLRERVRIEASNVDLALELIAERRGDRLVLVAFDAFGARALSVVQTGVDTEVDAPMGRAFPIGPLNLLRDAHAAGRFAPDAAERDAVQRTGCAHSAHFVRIERRELP
jgi:hypothetical protein